MSSIVTGGTLVKESTALRKNVELFSSGLIQVLLVAVNTYQISHKHWLGCFIVGFLISFIWSFNVKKIAFGTMADRLIYASGAACGTILGLLTSTYIYEILKW